MVNYEFDLKLQKTSVFTIDTKLPGSRGLYLHKYLHKQQGIAFLVIFYFDLKSKSNTQSIYIYLDVCCSISMISSSIGPLMNGA